MSADELTAREIIDRHAAAWNDGEMEALEDLYQADAVMNGPRDWPENRERLGWDEIRGQYDDLRSPWSFDASEILEFEARDDRSVGRFRWQMRGKDSEIELDQELSFSSRIEDGKIAEIHYFRDHADARAHFEQ